METYMTQLTEIKTVQLTVLNVLDRYLVDYDDRVEILKSLDEVAAKFSTNLQEPYVWRAFINYLNDFGPSRFFDWIEFYNKAPEERMNPFSSLKLGMEIRFYSESSMRIVSNEEFVITPSAI